MRRRDICGVLLLLVYLLGVGLMTGPSLYQLLIWHLPAPRLELIPLSDIISVLTDRTSPGLGAFTNIVGNLTLLHRWAFCCRCFGGVLIAQSIRFYFRLEYRSALN